MFIICSSCDYQGWHSSAPARVFICPSEDNLMETINYAMGEWAVEFAEIEVWKLGEKPCKVVLKVED